MRGLEAVIAFAEVGATLALSDIYERGTQDRRRIRMTAGPLLGLHGLDLVRCEVIRPTTTR